MCCFIVLRNHKIIACDHLRESGRASFRERKTLGEALSVDGVQLISKRCLQYVKFTPPTNISSPKRHNKAAVKHQELIPEVHWRRHVNGNAGADSAGVPLVTRGGSRCGNSKKSGGWCVEGNNSEVYAVPACDRSFYALGREILTEVAQASKRIAFRGSANIIGQESLRPIKTERWMYAMNRTREGVSQYALQLFYAIMMSKHHSVHEEHFTSLASLQNAVQIRYIQRGRLLQ